MRTNGEEKTPQICLQEKYANYILVFRLHGKMLQTLKLESAGLINVARERSQAGTPPQQNSFHVYTA